MLTGKHLIAGEWVASAQKFSSEPAHGPSHPFAIGTPEDVNRAVEAAEDAFETFSATTREERALLLERIAVEIDLRGDAITEIATQESGLPEARITGERGRTTGQLRLFASHIRKGDYLDRRIDKALPDRQPAPRPEIRLMQRPLGPVAVFGASNFPLAFSVAGGDTASALAAGCPVVVKGHPAHPGTGEIVAQAFDAAIKALGLHPGTFSLLQGNTRQLGEALVQHPLIKAVGFTGSLGGGRALFDLCARRPEPIPFYGELGSVNPMFLLPDALKSRGASIGQGWAGSLTMGAGQFCTNPGIAIALAGPAGDAFVTAAATVLCAAQPQTMLTDGIAQAYRDGVRRISGGKGIKELLGTSCETRQALPYLFEISAKDWLADHALSQEVFGPLGIVVRAANLDEIFAIARSLEGQLTTTLQLDEGDREIARKLVPILERKCGRILVNGFPTGVEVCDAMVHGGPYPASTNFGATSVGTMAIRRFLRPVSYQNVPMDLLPEDLRNEA